MASARCYVAIYNYANGFEGFHFIELPIKAETRKGFLVEDEDGDEVSLDDLNATLDHAAAVYRSDEPVAEIKADLEERVRLNVAHLNLCHPNVPLRESQR